MAGDWIKMRGNLWDDPRVARLCDLTDQSEAAIVGGLYWIWATADQHTEDGVMPGLTLRAIDRKTGIQGFGQGLCDIGWLADHPEGVRIVKFEEHNGTSAKRRCTDAQRKATSRSVSALNADNERTEDGQKTPNLGAREREEKRREEETQSKLTLASTRPAAEVPDEAAEIGLGKQKQPDCPHLEVLALWAEVLPALPQHDPLHWRGARADHLRARWRETAAAKHWQTQAEGLAYLRKFFGYVGQSRFLTGKSPPLGKDRRPFVIELEWLVSPSNWAKVHEGKYHMDEAAA